MQKRSKCGTDVVVCGFGCGGQVDPELRGDAPEKVGEESDVRKGERRVATGCRRKKEKGGGEEEGGGEDWQCPDCGKLGLHRCSKKRRTQQSTPQQDHSSASSSSASSIGPTRAAELIQEIIQRRVATGQDVEGSHWTLVRSNQDALCAGGCGSRVMPWKFRLRYQPSLERTSGADKFMKYYHLKAECLARGGLPALCVNRGVRVVSLCSPPQLAAVRGQSRR